MKFKIIPIIRIADEDLAKDFYLNKLSMQLTWRHQRSETSPVYMQILREDFVLQLSQFPQHSQFGSMVFVNTDGLDAIHQELVQSGFNCPDIDIAPWGTRVFEIVDPFSNKLLFNEPEDL